MGVEALSELTVFHLANMAECSGPDSAMSAGADFLDSVRVSVVERLADGTGDDDWHEVADLAVPVYTLTRWLAFVDLCAYNEDPTELGEVSDMTQAAGMCLYVIALRLADALAGEYTDQSDDDDGEGDS